MRYCRPSQKRPMCCSASSLCDSHRTEDRTDTGAAQARRGAHGNIPGYYQSDSAAMGDPGTGNSWKIRGTAAVLMPPGFLQDIICLSLNVALVVTLSPVDKKIFREVYFREIYKAVAMIPS